MPPGLFLSKKNAARKAILAGGFCAVVLAKTDSRLIAEAKLQKKALSVLLEKRLDFKAGEHAV
jgi:hypothetical protein